MKLNILGAEWNIEYRNADQFPKILKVFKEAGCL